MVWSWMRISNRWHHRLGSTCVLASLMLLSVLYGERWMLGGQDVAQFTTMADDHIDVVVTEGVPYAIEVRSRTPVALSYEAHDAVGTSLAGHTEQRARSGVRHFRFTPVSTGTCRLVIRPVSQHAAAPALEVAVFANDRRFLDRLWQRLVAV